MYNYKNQLPSPKDYNRLRVKVGWGELDLELVTQSLPKSLYSICAFYKGNIIGFARIVGDGGLCFYIQEIIVDPNHQRKGIASKFMEYILNYFSKTAKKRSYIGVFAGKNLENFYKKYGFWERPTIHMGAGMMQFWNDPEYNSHFNSV